MAGELPPRKPSAGWQVVRRNAGRTAARYRNVRLDRIVGLYARAATIGWRRPVARIPQPRPERVVVSLSTIPSRVDHLRSVLHSLLDQSVPADRIILALPAHSARENRPYPPRSALRLPPGVDVLDCPDLGPATKLLPARAAEPGAALIVVDDDVIYPPRFIETLLMAHRKLPGAALAYRGVRLAPDRAFPDLEHDFATAVREPLPVDILFGTWGYLLPPGALTDATGEAPSGELRWVDDVWVSGQLARRGIRRFVVAADEIPIESMNAARRSLAGGPNRSGSNDARAIAAFASDW
ncbi:MAG: glycosyltransferase family A protein [Devosia sp.]